MVVPATSFLRDIARTFKDAGLPRRVASRTSNHANQFRDALTRFIVRFNNPTLSTAQVEAQSAGIALPFNTVPIFHKIKYTTEDPYTAGGPTDSVIDAIHVQPGKQLKNGKELPARFDTACVNDGTGKMTGIDRDLIVVFTLLSD
ncbi:hypothetical protein B0H13DRAFT_2335403 [Mycena leptocephala]|nr:hypothetical protein B0H13DRAFT_2335403 [Mycena leptocephala]